MEKISFKLYREYGALNSGPVFDAVAEGLKKVGFIEVASNEDIPVIWSVLWLGRMAANKSVYHQAKGLKKPVMIIEVGNLKRNITWRVCLDNINGLGEFGNTEDLDPNRPSLLGVHLNEPNADRNGKILIATQHENSLQWHDQPPLQIWLENTINNIRKFSDRRIVVRHHPRWPIKNIPGGVQLEKPVRIPNSYDDFNINYNYHVVINHNSGPSVQAAVNGCPVICDPSGLAWPISSTFDKIESIDLPNRQDWFLKLSHTEWTVPEIKSGIPFSRIKSKILSY
jgi:hypothetical protein